MKMKTSDIKTSDIKTSDIKVSVAMAVYNGEKYIKEQLDTIISQLESEDELVISVDPSTDSTMEILKNYAAGDDRIHIYAGAGNGLMHNFENAITKCSGDVIVLSDQDDIWEKDKLTECRKVFADENVYVVLHDASIFDSQTGNIIEESFFKYKKCKKGILNNILKNSYMGCCMAFRKELLRWIMPFPKHLPMHDQWIGIMGEIHGKAVFIDKQLIRYRRHSDNMTKLEHAGIITMLKWRLEIISNIIIRNLIV